MVKHSSESQNQPIAKSQQPSAIPYGKQNITQADIEAVIEVLKSDYLTQGPKVKEFELAFAEYVGAKYAVALTNGTAALHLNCLALGVEPGVKVITSPITFAASANCVRYCGGEVVFADIDTETYLLNIKEVRKLLEVDSKKEIKGIIPVDFAGRSVDMEAYRALADEFGCWIIEDACHAPGAYFINSSGEAVKAGSGRYADLAIFSFHPVKHIATGEGGMITTNNTELYHKLLELRTHGITRDQNKFVNSIDLAIGDQPTANSQWPTANGPQPTANGPQPTAHSPQPTANSQWPAWYMEMQMLGYNYRISDINCALGLSQVHRAKEGLLRRHEIAAIYHEAFKKIPQITDRNFESANSQQLIANSQQPINSHAHHLYIIEVPNRLALYNYLRENNIYAQIHYVPCHLMPYYQNLGWKKGDFPKAENYYSGCISLPMYPSLTEEEQQFVIETIISYYI